ncbi:hypothetical protein E1B28_002971 [Marasmius oreades]|uniref:Nephrocystin 3-like N-terminal domain-containing protein n=1 Tax=Marasmius oreades TaxID=181124 RepID=A0A9P7RKN9_9AGAR|nr:uncharacterized protein E1B28_002971 [Marasmius oreades]KAG7085410.1 hypothetical protein E1B28_002971 [Marasmius oreades]
MSVSSQKYSFQAGNQHILNGARDTRIGEAVFNNVGGDQFNQNLYTGNPLWEAIADVGASHNSEQQVDRDGCLPGTREAVLELIRQWRVSGSRSMPVCWLSGAAGVGKSAIALTIAEECEEDHGLVASFFFFRSDPKRNNASSLILSIAHGLVVTRPHLKPLVDQRISADPRILKAQLEDQYKKLILQNLDHPPPSSADRVPNVVIIDGLDECGNAAMQRRVLSIIFSTYQQPFHHPLRFLICSRPESWIREEFMQFSGLTKHIKLDDSFRPRYDIELYLNQQFLEIRRDLKYSQIVFPDPWPSPYHFRLLVDKSDGQFIFAKTTTMFIKADYSLPTDQLCIVIDTITHQSSDSSRESPLDDLDKLYLMILRANPDRDKRLLPILAMIVVIQETSPAFIELVLGLSHGTVALTLCAMHSVLDVRDRDNNIKVYHKSFIDFLHDQARSREFFIDKSTWWDFLACRWTRVLTEQLRKDPELLRHENLSHSLGTLVERWNKFLDRVAGRMSSALISDVDAFYHVVLSISAELVGHEVLLRILGATLLLPPVSCFSKLVQLLLGLSEEVLHQALRSMDEMTRISDVRKPHTTYQHSTFRDFLFDRSRSRRFFIDKGSWSNFLALRSLFLLQMNDGHAGEGYRLSNILLDNWAHICIVVDNPTEKLMSGLYRMDLGAVFAKFLNYSMGSLFCKFETISTWLESKVLHPVKSIPRLTCFQTDSVAPPDLIDRFRNVQGAFHIRSTRQDVESGRHHNVITMIILSIVEWTGSDRVCTSLIMRDFVDHRSKSFRASVTAQLSAEFCGCSDSAFNSDCVSAPIPGKTDLYHINIPAGCAQIFKTFVSCLQAYKSRNFTHKEYCNLADDLLVWCPTLVTRCLPLVPDILSRFQTVLDIAKTLGRGDDYRLWKGYSCIRLSQNKLLFWLKNFPADCANEVETVRNNLLTLMPLNE